MLEEHAEILIKQYGADITVTDLDGKQFTYPATIDTHRMQQQLPVCCQMVKLLAQHHYTAKTSTDSELPELAKFWCVLAGAAGAVHGTYARSRYSKWLKLAEVIGVRGDWC